VAPQREWFEKDYYKTLGVPSTATAKEVTSAYRKLAKKHHPDTNPGDDELFKEISAAYDVLGDADKRKEYDEVRTMGPAGSVGAGSPAASGAAGAGAPSASTTPATSATSSAACSAAVVEAARPAPSAAATSRPSSTSRSRTPSGG
jgi:DnaJ-class molecular chaperone